MVGSVTTGWVGVVVSGAVASGGGVEGGVSTSGDVCAHAPATETQTSTTTPTQDAARASNTPRTANIWQLAFSRTQQDGRTDFMVTRFILRIAKSDTSDLEARDQICRRQRLITIRNRAHRSSDSLAEPTTQSCNARLHPKAYTRDAKTNVCLVLKAIITSWTCVNCAHSLTAASTVITGGPNQVQKIKKRSQASL